jgi:hypothetical protein
VRGLRRRSGVTESVDEALVLETDDGETEGAGLPVGCLNPVRSCGEGVFVDGSAEAVASLDRWRVWRR